MLAVIVILTLIRNIFIIVTDILAFVICMWRVWGIWKLKRETGIHETHSLVSVLIKQSILRCCFVVVVNITKTLATFIKSSASSFGIISEGFTLYQNALSSILVTDFILDLRSLNSAKIETSNASLPSLYLSNVLQHVHQSIIVELSTPENVDVEGNKDHDNPGSESVEVQGLDIQTA